MLLTRENVHAKQVQSTDTPDWWPVMHRHHQRSCMSIDLPFCRGYGYVCLQA